MVWCGHALADVLGKMPPSAEPQPPAFWLDQVKLHSTRQHRGAAVPNEDAGAGAWGGLAFGAGRLSGFWFELLFCPFFSAGGCLLFSVAAGGSNSAGEAGICPPGIWPTSRSIARPDSEGR